MRRFKLFINNQWVESNQTKTIYSPYDKSQIGIVHLADKELLQDAIQVANEAFQTNKFSSVYHRIAILEKLKAAIANRMDEFSELICREGGKPIRFARNEVKRALITIQSAIDVLRTDKGELIPLDIAPQTQQYHGSWERFPIGPVLGITPFNFPLNLVLHKLAPAIAAGNSFILKPSSNTPLTAMLLARLLEEIEIPTGLVQVVPCSGTIIESILDHPGIQMITFTGSPEVGWYIKEKAYRKKVSLELGGNAGVIVAEDADLDYAIPRLTLGAMAHSGQVCISVQRIYVQQQIFKEFKERFVKEVASIIPGDPMDESVIAGPLIDENELQRIDSWVKEALNSGAHLLCGGKSTPPFYLPTVLTNTDSTMKVWNREIFGPVVIIEPYDTISDAIRMVNDSQYGLQAAIFTDKISYADKAYRELDAGGIIINDYPTFRIDNMPYGGVKESGFGREGLKFAIEEMTEIKLKVLRASN